MGPWTPGPVKPYRQWIPGPLRRVSPYLGYGLLAWEIFQWYKGDPGREGGYGGGLQRLGWSRKCDIGGPKVYYATASGDPNLICQPVAYQVPKASIEDHPPIRVSGPMGLWDDERLVKWIAFGQRNDIGTVQRMGLNEQWARGDSPLAPNAPEPLYVPYEEPEPPRPQVIVAPDPADPWPFVGPGPQPTPAPRSPDPELDGEPSLYDPSPLPELGPFEQPGVEVRPDGPPAPVPHPVAPPAPGVEEKKTKLKGPRVAAWWKFLEDAVGGYTETDDFFKALYDALPWQVRRWKGRDGVWRERDISTAEKINRLGQYVDLINVAKAVENYWKNQGGDKMGGRLGEFGAEAVAKASGNNLYRGAQGLQSGGRFTKKSWDDALENLRKKAAESFKPKVYYTWEKDNLGRWQRKRRVTQQGMIPWLRVKKTRLQWRRAPKPGEIAYWQEPVATKGNKRLVMSNSYVYRRYAS